MERLTGGKLSLSYLLGKLRVVSKPSPSAHQVSDNVLGAEGKLNKSSQLLMRN